MYLLLECGHEQCNAGPAFVKFERLPSIAACLENHPSRIIILNRRLVIMGSDDTKHERLREQEIEAESAQVSKIVDSKALNAKGVHDALLLEGREEIHRHWTALAWSGFASGLTIGISMMAEAVLGSALPDTAWRPLIAKIGYSFGFVAVTLGRQQLYTETTLTAYLPWAHDKKSSTLLLAGKLWLVVLITNLIGAFLFAFAASHTRAFSPELHEAFRRIGEEASRYDFWPAFIKGIYGGWLIALMVWLLPAAQNARLWVIILITWLLSVTGLTHIVVGSVEVFYLVSIGEVSFWNYLSLYFIPVLIGNSIGGMALVAALNHAQAYPVAENN